MKRYLVVAFIVGLLAVRAEGATLLGQEARGGGKIDAQFPVDKYFQDYAAEGGNPRPDKGRALLFFPKNFDPARSWPILIVTSTTDSNRTSPMDAWWYRQPATAEGWIVLAADFAMRPQHDSTPWRLAMTAAALQVMRKEWPQSARWPVAFGGLSGGAKRSCVLSAMMAKSGTVDICGIFLAGINDDRLSSAYKEFQPSRDFLSVPVWISSGMNDPIAPPAKQGHVLTTIQQTGFQNVEFGSFYGGHEIKPPEVQRALRWFRQLGKF